MIEATLTAFQVHWEATSNDPIKVKATCPKSAAEAFFDARGNWEDVNRPLTFDRGFMEPADPVVVVSPDGTTQKFSMSARFKWTAEASND
tara:strand:+ start:1309 stop:1578 length:270 start_codon:yes stop_codon:yes gene_type:complete